MTWLTLKTCLQPGVSVSNTRFFCLVDDSEGWDAEATFLSHWKLPGSPTPKVEIVLVGRERDGPQNI